MKKFPIYLILDNIRSLYNVGSIFRIADGAGIEKVYLTGITGYPRMTNDARKPWEIESVSKKIAKIALGAEKEVTWEYFENAEVLVKKTKEKGIQIIALEKTEDSTNLYQTKITFPIAVIVGHETDGVSPTLLQLADKIVHIPMFGQKKSLNVATATAIAVYELIRRVAK